MLLYVFMQAGFLYVNEKINRQIIKKRN